MHLWVFEFTNKMHLFVNSLENFQYILMYLFLSMSQGSKTDVYIKVNTVLIACKYTRPILCYVKNAKRYLDSIKTPENTNDKYTFKYIVTKDTSQLIPKNKPITHIAARESRSGIYCFHLRLVQFWIRKCICGS